MNFHGKVFILLALASFSIPSQAAINVMSISVGPVWGNVGEAQDQSLTSDIVKTYTANRYKQTMADIELFGGMNYQLPHQVNVQLGLAIATATHAGLSGDIWDDQSPQFNNYTYHYRLRHEQLALKAKLLLDRGYPVIPWVSLSLGAGFNTASQYTNTPTIFEAVAMPNFASHTTTTFTYAIGIGVQRNLTQHWQAGLGYEFSDWGKSQLGAAQGQTSSSALPLSHFYLNGLLANLTYSA